MVNELESDLSSDIPMHTVVCYTSALRMGARKASPQLHTEPQIRYGYVTLNTGVHNGTDLNTNGVLLRRECVEYCFYWMPAFLIILQRRAYTATRMYGSNPDPSIQKPSNTRKMSKTS